VEDISIWLRELISEFRKESEKLSEEERLRISNLDDFFPPCQLLFLWPKDVGIQYLICMHDDNRKDMEIEVVGPFPTYEAINTLDSILKDPKYRRKLSDVEKKRVFDQTITFAEILEGVFLGFLQEIRNKPFQKPPPTGIIGTKQMVSWESFLWIIVGNIAELDRTKVIGAIMEDARKAAKTKAETSVPQPPKPEIKSCSTYFYPPIWVGKLPRKTFREKAAGSFINPEKALDLKYKGRVVVVNQDGLIAIGEESIPKATRMLNEIMATSLLISIEANAVRELEVCDATVDSSSLTITGWGTRTHTLRTQLFPMGQVFLEGRIEIKEEHLIRVFEQAERISNEPDISDFLLFLLEAHTHLQNSEYSQSFIMSWVIIERHMLWLWNKFLKEEQMSRERRSKLTNPAYWTIDFVLEGLNIGGQLTKEEYDDLMVLKTKRNDIIHQGESAAFEEAEKSLKIAKEIVKHRSGIG